MLLAIIILIFIFITIKAALVDFQVRNFMWGYQRRLQKMTTNKVNALESLVAARRAEELARTAVLKAEAAYWDAENEAVEASIRAQAGVGPEVPIATAQRLANRHLSADKKRYETVRLDDGSEF